MGIHSVRFDDLTTSGWMCEKELIARDSSHVYVKFDTDSVFVVFELDFLESNCPDFCRMAV